MAKKTHLTELDVENGVEIGGSQVIGSDAEMEDDTVPFEAIQNDQSITLQGAAELDLTTASTISLLASGAITAARGGDTLIPLEIVAYITSAVAADSTAPIITIEASDGTDSGLTLTLTDGDAVGDVAIGKLSDGDAVTAIDLTSNGVQAVVSQTPVDSGTERGTAKVLVRCLLVK